MPHQAVPGTSTNPQVRLKALKDNPRVVPSGPNRVLTAGAQPHQPNRSPPAEAGRTRSSGRCQDRLASVSAHEHPNPTFAGRGLHTVLRRMVLLRKEVIQPHLPVRLPCYDFVPIASPTFDGSLPYGLGRGLRVLPTFVT